MSEPDETAGVAELIEDDIIFGRIAPGSRLTEDALMARYGRTRHAVRQALIELEHKAIVVRERNIGATVRSYDRAQVVEIYQVREFLQRQAALMIRLPADGALIETLERLNDAFAQEGDRGNLRGVHESNDAFHLALFGACGNSYLVGSIAHYMGLSLPMRATTLADPAAFAVSLRQHAAMIALLQDTDHWALAQLCVEHVQPSKQDYLARTPRPGLRRAGATPAPAEPPGGHDGDETMMQDALYGGVNAAVVTPMRPDLTVDLDVMAEQCRWLLANGCNGLGILGTTGEANSLGVSERLAVMEGMVERGIPAAKMIPGIGTPAIPDTVLLAKRAAELGCRGVLALPPFFYKSPSEEGLVAYFDAFIQRLGTGMKIYLYHFPAQSAVPFTLSLVEKLLRAHPGVIKGIKDSSGDFANTRGYVDNFAKDGFEVYCGDDGALLDLLKIGGAGCITAAANVGCSLSAQVYANADNADGAAAQVTLAAVRKAVTSAPLIPALKALTGRRTGQAIWDVIRPPHMPLTAEQKTKLFATFDACGLTLKAA